MRCSGLWRLAPLASAALLAAVGCARDRSITRGADGAHDWERRLADAVPVGTPAGAARATLERNGFRCQAPDSVGAPLWCDKWSRGQFAVVRRRWQAVLELEGERVVAVKATTGLTGP